MTDHQYLALIRETFVSEVRSYPVAVSAEALALGWLRSEGAPHGALVVTDREIAGRTRNDEPLPEAAVNAAVAVRVSLPADHADILLAAALLAGADGCSTLGATSSPHWPEFVMADDPVAAVRVSSQLSPGVVDSAVITFRLGLGHDGGGEDLLLATMASLGRQLDKTPTELASAYTEACRLTGRKVRVILRPRGTAGGIGAGVDERGAFGVESSSGSVARHRVDEIRSVERQD